jgi:hypothetical protein
MSKHIWLIIPPVLFITMLFALFFALMEQQGRTVTYDCRISEISPDFPQEVRNECRKLRAKSGRI